MNTNQLCSASSTPYWMCENTNCSRVLHVIIPDSEPTAQTAKKKCPFCERDMSYITPLIKQAVLTGQQNLGTY